MDKTIEELASQVFGDSAGVFGTLVESMKNIAAASPITLREPANISDAIQMYEKRLEVLRSLKERGFETIAEYNEYKKAEDLIAKHKAKTGGPSTE